MVACGCGCGQLRRRFDDQGRERRYIHGHHSRLGEHRRKLSEAAAERNRANGPWNKGRTYVISSIRVYKTRHAWAHALRRLYGDMCVVCGWNAGRCDVHHLTPKSEGGEHTLANGVVICPNCHRLAEEGKLTRGALAAAKAEAAKRCEVV